MEGNLIKAFAVYQHLDFLRNDSAAQEEIDWVMVFNGNIIAQPSITLTARYTPQNVISHGTDIYRKCQEQHEND